MTFPSAPAAFSMKKVAQRVAGFLPLTETMLETCPSALASALILGFRWRPLLSKTCRSVLRMPMKSGRDFQRRGRSTSLRRQRLFRRHPFAAPDPGDVNEVFDVHVALGVPMREGLPEQEGNANLFRLLETSEVSRSSQIRM
jgi:hypothetical protein